jgi:hypothetical protein
MEPGSCLSNSQGLRLLLIHPLFLYLHPMPIRIHLPNNTTTPLFTLTDDLYTALTSPLTTLEEKTGIFIDPYGEARLSHQHAALLLKIINDEVTNKQLALNNAITGFTNFLGQMIKKQMDVMLVGD